MQRVVFISVSSLASRAHGHVSAGSCLVRQDEPGPPLPSLIDTATGPSCRKLCIHVNVMYVSFFEFHDRIASTKRVKVLYLRQLPLLHAKKQYSYVYLYEYPVFNHSNISIVFKTIASTACKNTIQQCAPIYKYLVFNHSNISIDSSHLSKFIFSIYIQMPNIIKT